MERIPWTFKRFAEMVMMCVLSIALAFGVLWLIAFIATSDAQAREWGQAQYAAPDVQEYYKSLKQPDFPKSSCCGDSDAYYTDRTDACGPKDGEDCAVVAIITDTRPDELTRADGSKVSRPHFDVGTRIPVPRVKIRKHPVPNPLDHGLIFVAVGEFGLGVYCYEPLPGL